MGSTYEVAGVIDKVLGNNNYAVTIMNEGKERTVLCYVSGKMRQFNINIVPGDQVTVQIPPPHDRGRITFRGQKPKREDETGREKRKSKKRQRR